MARTNRLSRTSSLFSLALVALLAALALTFAALSVGTASAAVADPNPLLGSNFQGGDGNQTATSPHTDWQTYASSVTTTVVDGESPDYFYAGKLESPDSWTLSSKNGGVTPGKANAQASSTFEDPLTGNIFFYFSFIREDDSTSETLYALEIRQNPGATWTNAQGITIPCRSNGDMLIGFNVDPSNKNVNITAYRWQSTAAGPAACPQGKTGQYNAVTPGPNAQAYMNFDGSITNYLRTEVFGNSLAKGRFGEGAINLSALFPTMGTNPCAASGEAQFFSLSSGSAFSSAMQDMISPATLNPRSCSVSGTKWSDNDADGNKDFNESGLSGWTFWVDYDDDGVQDANEPSGVSNSSGAYTISGVNPVGAGYSATGNYRIHERAPAGVTGYTCSFPTTSDAHGCYATANFSNTGAQTGFNFGNVPPGKIIIKKVNDGGTQSDLFNFTASGLTPGTFSVAANNANGQQYATVVPNAGGGTGGAYTVTEDAAGQPAGYTLTDVDCSDGDSTTSLANRQANIKISPGETVTCTFTNTKDAKVTITKVTNPASDTQDFSFTSSSSGLTGGAILDTDPSSAGTPNSQQFTIAGSQLGSKTITEGAVAGWTLGSISCSGTQESVNINSRNVTFDVEAGDDINCTFTNNKGATVTVTKVTNPASDAQDFSFTSSSTGLTAGATLDTDPSSAGISNSQTYAIPAAQLGSKTVTEGSVSGWTLTGVDCTGTTTESANLGSRNVTFTVAAGDDINCTFTNTKQATVTITKVTDPASDPQDFAFTSQSSGLTAGATLDTDPTSGATPNSQQFTIPAAQLGSKTVTESSVAGWALAGVDCTGTSSEQADLPARNVSFTVAAGDNINCTFTNRKNATVTITKVTNPASDTQDFSFTSSSPGLTAGATLDTDASSGGTPNSQQFTILGSQLGAKTIAETATAGWALTGVDCTGTTSDQPDLAAADVDFTVNAGDNINCTFTNQRTATVTITKVTEPGSDSQDFAFTSQSSGLTAGATLDTDPASGATPSSQSFTISPAQYGSKTITETAVSGWTLSNIDCSGTATENANLGSRNVTFTVAAGDNINCTFTNTKHATVTIAKTTNPASDPQDFAFTSQSSGLTAGVTLDTDGNSAGTPSSQQFSIVPADFGAKTVAEAAVPGWTLTDVDCSGTGSENADLAAGAVDFTVSAGDDITCTFTNTKDARVTIAKVTNPSVDPQDFDFTSTSPGLTGGATLDTDPATATPNTQAFTLTAAQLGAKTVAETAVAGWVNTDIDCTGTATEQTDLAAGAVDFTVSAGDDITCTFTNQKAATVTITKVTDPASDPQDFAFTSQSSGLTAGTTLDTDGNSAGTPSSEQFIVTPAQYGAKTVAETAVPGWTLTSVNCTGTGSESVDLAAGDVDFTVGAGDVINCTFTNTKHASVTIRKVTDPASDPQDFAFTSQSSGLTAGTTLDTDGNSAGTPSSQQFALTAAQLGSKTVAETAVAGWNLVGVDCSGTTTEQADLAAGDVDFTVGAGDDITCTFTNTADPEISIDKTGPTTGVAGQGIPYTINVTNSGPIAFPEINVVVNDAQCSSPPAISTKNGDATPTTLNPGDTWTYTCTVQTTVGQAAVHNVAIVTATDVYGETATDTDDADTTLTQPPTPPVTTPTNNVAGTGTVAKPAATSRLRGPNGCVSTSKTTAYVSGTQIRQVKFQFDGKTIKTVKKADSKGRWKIVVPPSGQLKSGSHRIVATVSYTAASGASSRKLSLRFSKCAAQNTAGLTG